MLKTQVNGASRAAEWSGLKVWMAVAAVIQSGLLLVHCFGHLYL